MYCVKRTEGQSTLVRDTKFYGRSHVICSMLKTGFALFLVMSISACSVTQQTVSLTDEKTLVTNAVTKPSKNDGVNDVDAEIIKTAVVEAPVDGDTTELAWVNPDTGNKGTILAIDRFVGSHGQKCKKFQTTVDTFMGISLYDGETCEIKRGLWVLSWFMQKSDG